MFVTPSDATLVIQDAEEKQCVRMNSEFEIEIFICDPTQHQVDFIFCLHTEGEISSIQINSTGTPLMLIILCCRNKQKAKNEKNKGFCVPEILEIETFSVFKNNFQSLNFMVVLFLSKMTEEKNLLIRYFCKKLSLYL